MVWTVGESHPRIRNANAAHYYYANGPSLEFLTMEVRSWFLKVDYLMFWNDQMIKKSKIQDPISNL